MPSNSSELPGGDGALPEVKNRVSLALFSLTLAVAAVTLLGSVHSLSCLLRMPRRTPLSLIVAAMSVDDLVSVVSLSLFAVGQWDGRGGGIRCTLSALFYVFQGTSGNMKASLIAVYVLYSGRRHRGEHRVAVRGAVAAAWLISLAAAVLPLWGWGSVTPTPLGCFADSVSGYALLLVSVYWLCLLSFLLASIPLAYQLLCSGDQPHLQTHRSRDSLEKSFETCSEMSCEPALVSSKADVGTCAPSAHALAAQGHKGTGCPLMLFAQKRFSFILAMIRITLWMPMMVQMMVSHVVQVQGSAFETPCFFLTFLSTTVTPLFVLSKRWIHMPCGCFFNCNRRSASALSNEKKIEFKFDLSFHQGYGIYKISQTSTSDIQKPLYHNLFNCDSTESRLTVSDSAVVSRLAALVENNASRRQNAQAVRCEATTESLPGGALQGASSPAPEHEDHLLDTSSVFDGPERRLSHGECRKIELTDWEWCRSKSERTPRQKSSGGLAIPLCAIQGTVSLHAPTGKTLSLSTYEVSSDGLKISPGARKVEVYRSKSVGHEPRVEAAPDTNVKIHLEVLEICDNEEALDSVSIISNISQSSAHARSPSLRYSRRENRFVSCDLGETASYSLLIPTGEPDPDINIHIPDTVEAHRQNSRRQQHQERAGYQEEIQLLNEAYRRQEES